MTQQRAGLSTRNPAKTCKHCDRAVRYVTTPATAGVAPYFTHVVTNHKWCDELDVDTLRAAEPKALPCRNCGQQVMEVKRWGMTEWTHTLGENDKCRPEDPFTGRARPVDHCKTCDVIGETHSHCPKCGALGLRFWEDAWANNWACGAVGCGYTSRYSLGD